MSIISSLIHTYCDNFNKCVCNGLEKYVLVLIIQVLFRSVEHIILNTFNNLALTFKHICTETKKIINRPYMLRNTKEI